MPLGGSDGEGGGEPSYEEPVTGGHEEDPYQSSSSPPPPPLMPGLAVILPVGYEKGKEKGKGKQEEQPASSFPEDVLLEILSRVPYRSLCRFKCVSKPWLALCSDPAIRRRSPQNFSGFFYQVKDGPRFCHLPGGGPPLPDTSLPFLGGFEDLQVHQCCGGLLLCRSRESDQCLVCNPATSQRTLVPHPEIPDHGGHRRSRLKPADYFLCFDPAAPSGFLLLAPLTNFDDELKQLAIYSSESGRWTIVQNQCVPEAYLPGGEPAVFLNGSLHISTHCSSILAVDIEGNAWRQIERPPMKMNNYTFVSIGQSQGRLYAWHKVVNNTDGWLLVWVLEDYTAGRWALKRIVKLFDLFGAPCPGNRFYLMLAVHPERSVIFLTDGAERTLAYDMDNGRVQGICTSGLFEDGLPYVPWFGDWS